MLAKTLRKEVHIKEITDDNYYDNLKAHGYTEKDLPRLETEGCEQYIEAMKNFDASWNTVWIDGSNQFNICTGDFTATALYVFEKDGKYRGLMIYYEFYLPDNGNYYKMTYDIIDFKDTAEIGKTIKSLNDEQRKIYKDFPKMKKVELKVSINKKIELKL